MKQVQTSALASGIEVTVAKLCRWLGFPRSTAHHQPRQRCEHPIDEGMAAWIERIHREEPVWGVRSTWSRLRFCDGIVVNRKKVHRIMKLKGWTPTRRAERQPLVKASHSVTAQPNQRWATKLARIQCGWDGWCVLVPVTYCCTREALGHALELTDPPKTGECALEEALLVRFDYALSQECLTHSTPHQNGLCECVIRTFKERSSHRRADSAPSNTHGSLSEPGCANTTPAGLLRPSTASPRTNTTRTNANRKRD